MSVSQSLLRFVAEVEQQALPLPSSIMLPPSTFNVFVSELTGGNAEMIEGAEKSGMICLNRGEGVYVWRSSR